MNQQEARQAEEAAETIHDLQRRLARTQKERDDHQEWINNAVASCAKNQCASRDRRLRDAEALYFESLGDVEAMTEARGLVAECLALNPVVSGDMEKVRVWADVVGRMRSFARE